MNAASDAFRWRIVGAAAVGLSCSGLPIILATFGVFLTPLSAAFGWSRAEISGALTAHVLVLVVAFPLVGRMIDRFGARRAILGGYVGLGATVAAIGMFANSLTSLYILYAAAAISGACASPVAFTRVITRWFTERRGFALGVALAGLGLGSAIMPAITQTLIALDGWRVAYIGLGALSFIVGVAVTAAFIRDEPALADHEATRSERYPAADTKAHQAILPTFLQDRKVIVMAATFLLIGLGYTGISVHMVPLLIGRGYSPAFATTVPFIAGLAVVVGRLASGWFLDRVFAPYVGIVAVLATATGCVLVGSGPNTPTIFLGAVLLGLSAGTEIDVMAYLVGRYFDLHRFGAISGLLNSAYFVGVAIGPISVGMISDTQAGYIGAVPFLVVALLIAAALFKRLPKYDSHPHHATRQ
ncbi:MAG: MFS transporter [Rhodospirillaceae bacterium]|nr:MFS transporter [Rhodospirillaceae bacterium]